MLSDRIGLIVWMRSLKQVKTLRRYGNIHYVSKRMKYVVLYCDTEQYEPTCERLSNLPFVKHIEKSQRPFLNTEFQGKKWDKAKEYDYSVK